MTCVLITSVMAVPLYILVVCLFFSFTGGHEQFPKGHPHRCYELLGKEVNVFEVLPGLGWDNIANKELGLIFDLKYNKCMFTEDGKYLIPDNIIVFPLKQSSVDVFAEFIDSMSSYSSATSFSINGGASFSVGLPVTDLGIGGSFDAGYQTAKLQLSQSDKKTFLSRVQARYNRYRINIQPDTPLSSSFKQRLLDIAKCFQLKNRRMGNYLSQKLLRDYGTHVLTSLDAGALYVKEDHINTDSESTNTETIRGMKLGAALSFKDTFDSEIGPVHVGGAFGLGYGNADIKIWKSKFENQTTESVVRSYGGIYLGESTSSSTWTDSLDNGLVAIDRQGLPIYDFVTPSALPELPETIVYDVDKSVKQAFASYYKHNIYRGCMDNTKNNFDVKANVDDGSCGVLGGKDNYFGGVFQKCQTGETDLGDVCSLYRHKNHLTGDYSCPSGYRPIKLISSTVGRSETDNKCHGIWVFKKCNNYLKTSSGDYTAYWCAPEFQKDHVDKYIFGGMYSSLRPNELSNTKSCPPGFQDLVIGGESHEIHVCAGDESHTIPGYEFGGLFSCASGNLLSLYINQNTTIAKQLIDNGKWPKNCPQSYSRHFVTTVDECDIEYCTSNNNNRISGRDNLPVLQRPPFIRQPALNNEQVSKLDVVLLGSDGSWHNNEKAYEKMNELKNVGLKLKTYKKANTAFMKLSDSMSFSDLQPATKTLDPLGAALSSFASDSDDEALSPAVVAVISSLTTMLCVVGATTLVIVCKKRFHRSGKMYRNVDVPKLDSNEGSEDEDNDALMSIVNDNTNYGSA